MPALLLLSMHAPLLSMPVSLTAQSTELTALRGEIGVDPEPGTLLATLSRLSLERVTLPDALVQLAEHSGVQIAFSPSLLPAPRFVDCDCATKNVARALDGLLAGTELGYVELGSQVIIVPRTRLEVLPRDATLNGRVRSALAVPVAGATARLTLTADSTVRSVTGTDALGFFAFRDLMAGRYRLTIGRIGYRLHDQEIALAPDTDLQLEISLAEEAIELEAVVVEARRSRERARFEESAGLTVHELSAAQLRSIPGVAEPDPVRAMDVLPGVTRVSDFTAVLNVRGGSGDQNLILMDRVPLFHPYHLLGLFSVFNPDMVQRAELRSGGFPAEYGGRASSVMLVESDVGDGDLGVDAGLGLISSRLAVRGSLPAGSGTAWGSAPRAGRSRRAAATGTSSPSWPGPASPTASRTPRPSSRAGRRGVTGYASTRIRGGTGSSFGTWNSSLQTLRRSRTTLTIRMTPAGTSNGPGETMPSAHPGPISCPGAGRSMFTAPSPVSRPGSTSRNTTTPG